MRDRFRMAKRLENQLATEQQAEAFYHVCQEFRNKYGQMPAYLARKWIKENPRVQDPNTVQYRVYLMATGKLVAVGNSAHCANAMRINVKSWYNVLHKMRVGQCNKWVVMVDDGRHDGMEELP